MSDLISRCPRSYLLGFYFGDGSSYLNPYGSWHHKLCANEYDRPRVDANAGAVGVVLNWSATKNCAATRQATWPKAHWSTLELERFQGYNGYTRRTHLLPLWTNEDAFVEGIWDADGSARVHQSKSKNKVPHHKLALKITNEGLANDVADLLRKHGIQPTVRSYRVGRKSTKLARQVYIWYRDIKKFHQHYTLQPYKQAQLDLMVGA